MEKTFNGIHICMMSPILLMHIIKRSMTDMI